MPDYDEHTALIVVDMQNDFADPAGSLSVAGGDEILPAVNASISAARNAGALVVYTQDWHPASTPHFEKDGGIWPVHCVADTWGADFHPELDIEGDIVRKGTGGEDGYSGFSVRDPQTGFQAATRLDGLLHDRNITTVVIVGLATDYCVKETALDGVRLGYQVTVLTDQVRAVDLTEGDGEKALRALSDEGALIE